MNSKDGVNSTEQMENVAEMHWARAKAAVDQGGLDTMSTTVQIEILSSEVARHAYEISTRLDKIIELLEKVSNE